MLGPLADRTTTLLSGAEGALRSVAQQTAAARLRNEGRQSVNTPLYIDRLYMPANGARREPGIPGDLLDRHVRLEPAPDDARHPGLCRRQPRLDATRAERIILMRGGSQLEVLAKGMVERTRTIRLGAPPRHRTQFGDDVPDAAVLADPANDAGPGGPDLLPELPLVVEPEVVRPGGADHDLRRRAQPGHLGRKVDRIDVIPQHDIQHN